MEKLLYILGGSDLCTQQNWRLYLTNNQQIYTKSTCHKGNTAIYAEKNGGTLYIGGWNNGAYFDSNTHVIDLTGLEHKYWDIPVAFDKESEKFLKFTMQAYAGWLSLPFPDYGIPAGMQSYEQWYGIAQTIREILAKGNDVLVACHGGHGRSGLFCAIVGYILNIKNDNTWASPVEKVRELHCDEAVETLKQEEYVYNVLGLRIQINRSYYVDDSYFGNSGAFTSSGAWKGNTKTYRDCPICGTNSMYIDDYGMCLSCNGKYKDSAVTKFELTTVDISGTTKEWMPHEHMFDKDKKCMGIWKAEKCGHVVHDQIIYDGLCEVCYQKQEMDAYYAEQAEKTDKHVDKCALCHKEDTQSANYGVCYECAETMVVNGEIDEIHNSITDPYRGLPHKCESGLMCIGVFKADVCGHVVHDREVQEGLCPKCYEEKHKQEAINEI